MIRTHILPCQLPKVQADALNRASGAIYSRVLITHYRVYRKKGRKTRHWLSPRAGEQLNDYLTRDQLPLLHAHSKDAAQQGFYKACRTARVNRHLGAKYPHKRKYWRTTVWKPTGIRDQGDHLLLARAKGLLPIIVRLPEQICALPLRLVREVRLVWDRYAQHYTWHLVIENGKQPARPPGANVVAVDLGEIHPAACTDGQQALIVSARVLRYQRQYLAKRLAKLQGAQAAKTKGSRRYTRLQRRKTRVRAKQRRRHPEGTRRHRAQGQPRGGRLRQRTAGWHHRHRGCARCGRWQAAEHEKSAKDQHLDARPSAPADQLQGGG